MADLCKKLLFMNHRTLLGGVLAAVCMLTGSANANELKLRYDRPARYFEEALVIGNGSIGAIVYGDETGERLSLNDITLWSGEPPSQVICPGRLQGYPGDTRGTGP